MHQFHSRHAFSVWKCLIFAFVLSLASVFQGAAIAQDEPRELSDLRQGYRKEVEFATRSLRDRYMAKLEGLKRTLGARSDFRGALAVEQEIDRVKQTLLDAMGVEKFAGVWKLHYNGSEVRRYVINTEGTVSFSEHNGAQIPPKSAKIVFRDGQYTLDLGFGELERLSITPSGLTCESFQGKEKMDANVMLNKGVAQREATK